MRFPSSSLGAFIDGRWYKNTSLRQQWGFIGNIELAFPLDEEENGTNNLQRSLEFTTGVNWLWDITDRVLLQSLLANYHTRVKQEVPGSIGGQAMEFTEWRNQLVFDMDFSFFIENQLQLNVLLGPSLIHRGDSESDNKLNARVLRWNARVGLRYYLSRNLY